MMTKEQYYELVLENRRLASDPEVVKCTCPNALCEWHGRCRECIALHRFYEHVPACLQPIIAEKVKTPEGIEEITTMDDDKTPAEFRQYVKERDEVES